VADTLPDARQLTLEGHPHDVDPDVLAPVLEDFAAAGSPSQPRPAADEAGPDPV
jgi:hypothetical protein